MWNVFPLVPMILNETRSALGYRSRLFKDARHDSSFSRRRNSGAGWKPRAAANRRMCAWTIQISQLSEEAGWRNGTHPSLASSLGRYTFVWRLIVNRGGGGVPFEKLVSLPQISRCFVNMDRSFAVDHFCQQGFFFCFFFSASLYNFRSS